MNALIVLASLAVDSRAAEVQFEGFYRARFRAFDTLSLERDDTLSEGLAAYAQHRLWLAPRFLLSDDVSLFVELRGLDNVPWGVEQRPYQGYGDPVLNLLEYDLGAPTSDTDARAPLLDITLWRAYGEINTPAGQFTFGRVPLHWGSGIWLNDGISVEPLSADYGDTTDRLMWEKLIEEQFYLRASIDVPAERFLGENDDSTAFGLAAAYRAETITAGVLLQLDHTAPQTAENLRALNVFSADVAADVVVGKLDASTEVIGQFGGGDLAGGLNDVSITAVGAVLEAGLNVDPIRIQLQAGLATGDGNPSDKNLRQFAFDRDYSVGMFLFEQPMPVLATPAASANAQNGGRDFSEVLTGNAVTNALFLKPKVVFTPIDGLSLDLSLLLARAAKVPPVGTTKQSRGYGQELQLGASYTGIPHFEADARAGLFLPRAYYSRDLANPNIETGFDRPALGAQITGRIHF